MKKAIMIGAGQIGRGFIGMELERAGYHVLFADINREVIEDLQRRGQYTVCMLDTQKVETVVKNISAICSLDPSFPTAFADEELELVCTSVGQTALAKVAGTIAQGIRLRCEAGICAPINIIAVENAVGGTSQLKTHIFSHLSDEMKRFAEKNIGFPNSAVDRIIPKNKGDIHAGDVVVERYFEWDVERAPLKVDLLPIDGLHIVDDLSAFLERKLFTLNGPNAVTACYGYLKGYDTIKASLEDEEIYAVVWGMMEECGAMLEKRHGFTAEQMLQYRCKLMERFVNPYIIDSVARVAREPVRKLSPQDRIIAPMKYAHSFGIATPAYYTGIASVLLYDNPDDIQSQQIQREIQSLGVPGTLEKICGIPCESEIAQTIAGEYRRLSKACGLT